MSDSTFALKEKVQIILTEYSALKPTISTYEGYAVQIPGFLAIAITLLGSNAISAKVVMAAVLIGSLYAGSVIALLKRMKKADARLRQIEHYVNIQVGESLLSQSN